MNVEIIGLVLLAIICLSQVSPNLHETNARLADLKKPHWTVYVSFVFAVVATIAAVISTFYAYQAESRAQKAENSAARVEQIVLSNVSPVILPIVEPRTNTVSAIPTNSN